MNKLCKCGCGKEVLRERSTYISGHNSRVPEFKQKMSLLYKGKHISEETRRKISLSLIGNTRTLGFRHSEETKRKNV